MSPLHSLTRRIWGMPRRLKLSSLQRDILMMLEEAGAETVGTIVATLKPSDQREFLAELDGLLALGLTRKDENSILLTELGRIALRT